MIIPLVLTQLLFSNIYSNGDALAYTLKAFVELMDHGIVSWDVLQHKFIKNVRVPISIVQYPTIQ